MPAAEIITIGTEILLGDIVDTNARYIARALRDVGVDVFRKTTVGDNTRRIAEVIQQAMQRADIIITTGGLGPTVDDPTREGVALAVGTDLEYRPELWEQIKERFQRYGRPPTENNQRQAYIPHGAQPITNPVGTAPAFIVHQQRDGMACTIFSLPGVPREMEYLLEHAVIPGLREQYNLHGTIKSRIIHTSGAGESMIDDRIGDLELLSNPTVGLAAHSGQVDVRITAKAGSEAEADAMIQKVEEDVRQRLGRWIYGADADTLERVAMKALEKHGWTLAVLEAGLGGELIQRLASETGTFAGGEILAALPAPEALKPATEEYRRSRRADVGLGVMLIQGAEKAEVSIELITPEGEQSTTRSYGGPPGYAPYWAGNHSLDLIRQL